MTARMGQVLLVVVLVAVGYYFFTVVQGSVKSGVTIKTEATTLQTGLVGHWTFDGMDTDWSATGAEVLDSSGNGYDGEAQGSVSATSSPAPGVIGQAFQFNSTSDGVRATLSQPTTALSISFWARPDSVSPAHEYDAISAGLSTGAFRGIQLIFYTDGYLYFGTGDGSAYTYLQSTNTFTTEWQHVVVTWDGTTKRMYVDGVQDANTESFSGPIEYNSTTVYLGKGWSTGGWFGGSIDDMRMYNRALSADEVTELYNLGAGNKRNSTLTPTGLQSGLVGHWTFDGNDTDWGSTTAEVQDVSGNGNDGDYYDPSAGPTVTGGAVGQAGYFDGIAQYVRRDDASLTGAIPSKSSGGATDFSVSSWAYFVDYSERRPIVSKQQSFVLTRGFLLGKAATGDGDGIEFEVAKDNTSTTNLQTDTAIGLNEWHLITATYDYVTDGTSIMRIYIDGEEATSTTTAVGPPNANSIELQIGKYKGSPESLMRGGLDDVRIYDRVLSADEVTELYGLGAGNKVAKTITPTGLQSGLVGHWTFDGKDMDWGSTTAEVLDVTGNGNNGDALSGMSIDSVAPGRFGQALKFDGINDYIGIATDSALDFPSPTDEFTFSAWVKLRTCDSSGSKIIENSDAGPEAISLECNSSNKLQFAVYTNNAIAVATSTISANDNEWHLATGVKIGHDSYIYVDGVLDGVSTNGGTFVVGWDYAPYRIGASIDGANREVDGLVDDVRIYDRALSADEILQLYNMGR